jgi:hypothetical protein
MKMYGGGDEWLLLTSVMDECEWSASRPGCFIPEEMIFFTKYDDQID